MNDELLQLSVELSVLQQKIAHAATNDMAIDPQWVIDARDLYAKLHRLWKGKKAVSSHDGYARKP
jgi:hypothetical protein